MNFHKKRKLKQLRKSIGTCFCKRYTKTPKNKPTETFVCQKIALIDSGNQEQNNHLVDMKDKYPF